MYKIRWTDSPVPQYMKAISNSEIITFVKLIGLTPLNQKFEAGSGMI